MKNTNNLPKYLYHATSMSNLIAILKEKILIPKGKRINGYVEDTVSFLDILNDYMVFYGDIIIEFFGKNLIRKNSIYPHDYGLKETDPGFYDMPFWEAEWKGKEIKFEYEDINKIYFLEPPLLSIVNILLDNKIKFEIISEKDLPRFSEEYYIMKYKERINRYKCAVASK